MGEYTGSADYLEQAAEYDMQEVKRLNAKIEGLERDIVQARDQRIEAARRAADARAAAHIIRERGLRSEIVNGVVNISVNPSDSPVEPDRG